MGQCTLSKSIFRHEYSEKIFNEKYRHDRCETWEDLARTVTESVVQDFVDPETKKAIENAIAKMYFIPGGRYLYYAGRPVKYWNNCYLLRAEEDTREDWANLSWKSESCLITGGGIGIDYSVYRPKGATISRTGGTASGPIPKMQMVNEIGRRVMQGGARRSALYASLNWRHQDVNEFLTVKDWEQYKVAGTDSTFADVKKLDFDFPCPLDGTNISVNYDTKWLMDMYKTGDPGDTFKKNILMAMKNGEPGFSFNFFDKETETLRNACSEVSSSDDSDVCNLGSLNFSRIPDIETLATTVELATIFLLCGTMGADVPYTKIGEVRAKNRRLGLGIMGLHEWLLQRGYRYEVTPELHKWMNVYKGVSRDTADYYSDKFSISRPVACRAIAPNGTIGGVAGTTTGIEPVFGVAYKRRYISGGNKRKYQYVIEHAAQDLIDEYGLDPDTIDSASGLANNIEQRLKFQADIQDYVDMSISSTVNLPAWGSDDNNVDKLDETIKLVAKYAPRLRGLTFYPDGSRGGQPLTVVPYAEAKANKGKEFDESDYIMNDVCDITGSGYCGS